jgi:hypothetical protein
MEETNTMVTKLAQRIHEIVARLSEDADDWQRAKAEQLANLPIGAERLAELRALAPKLRVMAPWLARSTW